MHEYVTSRSARRTLGVSDESLRVWADRGLIPSVRTPGGQRRYDIQSIIGNSASASIESNATREQVCYCRVSSQGQKEDLHRQVQYMQERFPSHKIITDIGSGINFKRKGLRTLLELAHSGTISEVVVAYKDRLCRFAFELLEWIFQFNGVKLVVLHQSLESSGQAELAEDLLSIINVFNCRVNGRRKYTKKTIEQSPQIAETASESSSEGQVEP